MHRSVWPCDRRTATLLAWTAVLPAACAVTPAGPTEDALTLDASDRGDGATGDVATDAGAHDAATDAVARDVEGIPDAPGDAASGSGEQARSADAFVDSIGVCTHFGHAGSTDTTQFDAWVHERLTELGVRHVRTDFADAASAGANALQALARDATPIHAMMIVNPRDAAPADVPADAAALLPALEAIEGPNEPNLGYESFSYLGMGFPAGVRAYQRDLYAAMHGASNAAVRALPVVETALGMVNMTDVGLLGDVSAWVDFASLHNYPGGQNPLFRLTDRIALALQSGGAAHRVFVTETGWHNLVAPLPGMAPSQPGISEEAGGRYVPRLFLLNFDQPQIARTYEYDFIDDALDAPGVTDQEHHFGLLRNNGSRKPGYASLRNLISLLADPGPAFALPRVDYALDGDLTGIEHTLLARRDGRVFLIFWQEVVSYRAASSPPDLVVLARPLMLTLRTRFASATLYAPHQGTAPLAPSIAAPRSVALLVPDHPLVVELTP